MVEFKFKIGEEVYHGRSGIGGHVIGLYQNRSNVLITEVEYITENGSLQVAFWPETELELM